MHHVKGDAKDRIGDYLQYDPEGPCDGGKDHEERSFDPRHPVAWMNTVVIV